MEKILVKRVKKWNKRLIVTFKASDVSHLLLEEGSYVNISKAFPTAMEKITVEE